MKKKKLLIYAHYYYPDVASTGQILMELAEGLKDDFDITVICVVPSYTGVIDKEYKKQRFYYEEYNGVNIIRVKVPEFEKTSKKSRIKNLIFYFINSILATFKVEKQDYIFTISQPPILGGMLGVIGKIFRGGKLIYNIQDFNPEQVQAVGYSKNKCLIKIALLIDKVNCRYSEKVIVVGRDMQQNLIDRFGGKKVPRNVFINNWINEKEVYPIDSECEEVIEFKKKYDLSGKFIIMYSGNIGLYYDLENIIKVIEKFKDRNDVVFAFVGDGTVRKKLEKYVVEHSMKNVKFIPYQPKEKLKYSLNAADVHFVVNAKGIKGVSVPSKLYGVMAVGKPVLGILEKGSEGRFIIEESDCGICIEPADYEKVYKYLKYILDNKDIFLSKGIKGRKYLENNLAKNLSIDKYKNEILSV